MNPHGRPVEWTLKKKRKAVDIICCLISSGMSLKSVLKNDDSLPPYPSFMSWITESDEFLEKYRTKLGQKKSLILLMKHRKLTAM
jgi:hypothetical protein